MLYKRCDCENPTKCKHAFYYEFEVSFRKYRKSTRTANRQLAERIESRRRIKVLDGKDDEPEKPFLLSTHIADYQKHTKEHNVTHYKDVGVLTTFKTIVGDKNLREVAQFDVERWKLERAKEVSKSTVNRELNIIRGCFARAVEWSRIAASPLKTVKPFKVDDHRVRVLDDAELKKVLACDDAFVSLVCRVTLECLPRLSEVLNIHRSHIGPSWIEFRRKGGKVTRAAVTDELRKQLLARCHAKSGAAFGEGKDGEPPTEQTASNRIVRALVALKVKDASHHTMRHTGVTLMLERGTNPRVIQMLAGWSSLRMLERYGHARDAELRKAVEGNAAYLQAVSQ